MNLLIFILSLIMMLSLMTYARLESFTKSHVQASEWLWLMKESERDTFNKAQKVCNSIDKKKADKAKKDKETKDNAPPPPPPPEVPKDDKDKEPTGTNGVKDEITKPQENESPSPGSGKISLGWFLDKSFREKYKDRLTQMTSLMETFIATQWGNQPFYKKLEKDRPNFVPLMFEDMYDSVEKAKLDNPKFKVSSLDDLLFITWKDPELKTAFARMLQEGLTYKRDPDPSEGISAVEKDSPKGYQSLNDFFASKKNEKIRVWLAPKALLLALYGDPKTVEEIVKTREAYYKEMRNGSATAADLKKKFEELFSSRTNFNDLLDYTVTTTQPKNS